MFKSDMKLVLFVLFFRIIFGNILNDLDIPIHLKDSVNQNDDFIAPKEEIHLEDFFWTGSGEGPPNYIKNVHTGISRDGNNVFVKTETVVATVYVDGNNEIYNNHPSTCIDCTNNGLPINYTTTDRRYWLLTVVSGYFQQKDYILLEDKLAQLYRLAFTRQQSKHLGIEENRKRMENLSKREKRQTNSSQNDKMDRILNPNQTDIDDNHIKISKFNSHLFNATNSNSTRISTSILPVSITKLHNILLPSIGISNKSKEDYKIESNSNQKNYQQPKSYSDVTDMNFQDTKSIYSEQQVQIFIHNVTLLTEDDIENWEDHSYEQDINDKRDSRPLANQTEIIYSVFVNGKPVLATTAAEDMKLLSESEVSSIMGKIVFMKAEPYLREPQATPLVPASKSGPEPSFLAYIQDNPVLVVVSSIAMMLVLILLLALLLMTRSKRERSAEVKRLSSRHGLLSSTQQSSQGFDTGRTDRPSTVASHNTDGVQNYGYEHDTTAHRRPDGRPHISFPLPPAGSRPGSASTVSTSDSSVYCPVNRPNIDLQHMLDEKAAKLFDKKRKISTKIGQMSSESNKNVEPIYTSVINGGGGARKRDKKSKQKHRRRYLQENRVGSIEELDIHSSAETSLSTEDDNISDSFKPDYENFESNEAYNLHNNYHRNKILQNHIFTDKIYDTVHEDVMTPTEAINREIIKALQPAERSSETGSIGSFLSMASVKSFPKSTLPEPLHRVLEPVSVTYYDHYDEPIPKSSLKQQHGNTNSKQTSATIEKNRNNDRKVDRKRDGDHKTVQIASQSDNPDPGVLGPIVWEIHKKKLTRNDESLDSPLHDPATTRNRYEGLLEGAIQMYDDHAPPSIKKPSTNSINSRICSGSNRNLSKENRGKSAIVSSSTERLHKSDIDSRPFTAGPDKTIPSNQSTQPPSPNCAAWTNSGTASPLVRPLSAGPFHRPSPPVVDVTRILVSQSADRGQLSAAPLIEAIQNELQKFKRDNSH